MSKTPGIINIIDIVLLISGSGTKAYCICNEKVMCNISRL
jgi:D-arabinose 5-phosphate isomerase GutQ